MSLGTRPTGIAQQKEVDEDYCPNMPVWSLRLRLSQRVLQSAPKVNQDPHLPHHLKHHRSVQSSLHPAQRTKQHTRAKKRKMTTKMKSQLLRLWNVNCLSFLMRPIGKSLSLNLALSSTGYGLTQTNSILLTIWPRLSIVDHPLVIWKRVQTDLYILRSPWLARKIRSLNYKSWPHVIKMQFLVLWKTKVKNCIRCFKRIKCSYNWDWWK